MQKTIQKHKAFRVLISVIALLALIDAGSSLLVNAYLRRHSLPGEYQKIEYLMKDAKEEMVIIGSSVAISSYIPQIIEDSLHISCFNGGCSSQYLPFFQCMIENLLRRYTPRYLVLVMRSEELAVDELGRLNLLSPFYRKGYPSIDHLLDKTYGKRNIFLYSNLYRYNTIGWRILLSSIRPSDEIGQKGFVPHNKPKFPPVLNDWSNYTSHYRQLNPIHEECFRKIVELCRQTGVELIVTIPPVYKKHTDHGRPFELLALEYLCRELTVPLFNDNQSPFFLSRPDLFYDDRHLNYGGAEIYTWMFVEEFRQWKEGQESRSTVIPGSMK
ncbi:MAG: hypothetical protein FWF52_08980 [Candidatus Azobacteroides sp.]|nr:hypothetical protein [Candidatus Azobacteroides sp.]